MARELPEWIGSNPDAKIPPRVRLRVFERHNGVCHISGRKIQAGDLWECDHIVALINGGEHRESNLAPALKDKHREKTKEDVAIKAKTYERRSSHLGIRESKTPMPFGRKSKWKRKMNGEIIPR